MAVIVAAVVLSAAMPAFAQATQSWDTQALVREAGALTAEDLPPLEERATKGDARSQVLLALANEMGSAGLTANAVQALAWLRKAVDQGVAWAEMWAGDFYYTGSAGVPRDLYEAMRLYQLSSSHGNPRAAFFVGRMYFFGEGVAVNHAEAAAWFRRAAPVDPEFIARMVALAEAPCQTSFCVSFRQLLGARMAQLPEIFVGDWDDLSSEWESVKDLPGSFARCGFTSSNRTSEGEVENYFCDTDPIEDAAVGNATAKDVADQVATALSADWSRSTEMRDAGSAYFFTRPEFPRVRVSYNATQGKAYQRVTVLIGR
jgi:hypothetical protein